MSRSFAGVQDKFLSGRTSGGPLGNFAQSFTQIQMTKKRVRDGGEMDEYRKRDVDRERERERERVTELKKYRRKETTEGEKELG